MLNANLLFVTTFLTLTTFVTAANASNCTAIRLDAPGMPLENIPIHDQDGLNICDHYAAAQIIDAHRFYENGKRFNGHVSSPIALSAMLTSKFKDKTSIEGLMAEDIIRLSHKIGTCNDETLVSKMASSDKVDFCEELKWALNKIRPNRYNSASKNVANSSMCSVRKDATFGGFQGIDLLAEFLGANKDLQAVANEIQKICSGNMLATSIKKPNYLVGGKFKFANTTEEQSRHATFKNLIDSALDNPRPMPAGIRYCAFVLTKDSFSSVNGQSGHINNCTSDGQSGAHASIIVGRRPSKSGNGCQYLIRNTYGTSCNSYLSKWECDKTKGGNQCPPGTQCGGQIWVDETDLLKNTQDIFVSEAP